jgi:lysophospholipase L1-like esterase
MDRRSAVGFLGSWLLAGCGGGGGSSNDASAAPLPSGRTDGITPVETAPTNVAAVGAPAAPGNLPAGSKPPVSAVAKPLSSNIAVWGDSITDIYYPTLRALYPNRNVFNGGVSGQTSMQIAARMTADSAHKTWVTVFWYGHNNWTKDEVKSDIAASVSSLAPGNSAYVVLSMLNWADGTESRGQSRYDMIMRVNQELAATYANNFLDIRSHLVSLYNRNNSQDVKDFQNDLPPTSLRFDTIHPNEAGCDAIAKKLQEYFSSRGW